MCTKNIQSRLVTINLDEDEVRGDGTYDKNTISSHFLFDVVIMVKSSLGKHPLFRKGRLLYDQSSTITRKYDKQLVDMYILTFHAHYCDKKVDLIINPHHETKL